MTQDEIIDKDFVLKMAKKAKAIPIHKDFNQLALIGIENIEAFAKLVAQHAKAEEREACAKICEELSHAMSSVGEFAAKVCAKFIREQQK